MVTQEDIQAGQSPYNPFILFTYDFFVLGLSNHLIWKCPTQKILDFYNQNITSNHLDVGVGTGYFLDKCNFPAAKIRLGLMDLNINSLKATEKRISRYNPEIYNHNVYSPMNSKVEGFDSIGINYLLHCLPGNMLNKADVFQNLNIYLNSGGKIFGSTLLQGGVERSPIAKKLMEIYNEKKIFTNVDDDLDSLEKILHDNYTEHSISISGCAALFWAIKN
ncbi:MAG: class I SAM-dependent methyltransferase [Symploca sp. SIO2D2]|nr:class I SAM-dependent methyltransferase [Symploca sp. SIO2D2]